jgi:hypothetical protein
MIDEVDHRLKAWVFSILGEVPVSLASPARSPQNGIGLYLMELRDRPPLRGSKRSPLQFALRYLITSCAEEPEEAHRALGRLLFAAMENAEFEIEKAPVSMEVWQAFGVPPQPSFTILVPIQQERPQPTAPLVRQPLVANLELKTALRGVLLGPGEIPLADASVRIPSLRLSSRTDSKGRFYFHAVPRKLSVKSLEVNVKGRSRAISASQIQTADGEPWVIHFDFLEE